MAKNEVFLVGQAVPHLTRWITFDQDDFFRYSGGELIKTEEEANRLEMKYVHSVSDDERSIDEVDLCELF